MKRKPVKGTWRPPSLRELWETQGKMQELLRELDKKVNAGQMPLADRVVNNQAAEAVAPESSMSIVRKRVCHINGHLITALIEETPTVPTVSLVVTRKTTVLCQHCGMTLEEIRAGK